MKDFDVLDFQIQVAKLQLQVGSLLRIYPSGRDDSFLVSSCLVEASIALARAAANVSVEGTVKEGGAL